MSHRRFSPRFAVLFVAVSALARMAAAEDLDVIVGGAAGGAHVRATAVAPGTFRLRVGFEKDAAPIASAFIDPAFRPGDVGKVVVGGGHSKLVTDKGTLDIDVAAGTYELLDSRGAVLVPPAAIAERATADGKARVDLRVGWPGNRPFEIYGCGNGADALVQRVVTAHVGNGVAVIPFFWAPAGFATFVVGADDETPASCDGKVAGDAVTWRVAGHRADLYLIIAPRLADATGAYLDLTGRPPVPPRWAFGYLQSRWGWKDKAYIDDTLREFEARKLPVDAFIFDFEWYTTFPDYDVKPEGVKDFSDFGWNKALFPDPAGQIAALHAAGVRFVGIRKPRLGNRETLAEVRRKGWGFEAGDSLERFDARGLLFANADARAWYAGQITPLLRAGVDGWWNDEGEFTYANYLHWNQAEAQALAGVDASARLWTLNRSFQPGAARYGAATWSGDIGARWADLARTPATLLNWGLAGMPECGCDIGGFFGEVTPELLVRWMQAGTFFPMMRCHSDVSVKPHFPWLFGPEAEAAIRKTLDLRYQLIPALYSLSHATRDGDGPMMRPLVMQYPSDPKVADLTSEWLVGESLLAAPMLAQGGHRKIYLPDDIWFDFASGERVGGVGGGGKEIERDVAFDAVPLYVRGGTILPLAPVVQHTRDLPGGPLAVHVYPGRDGTFTLVEDDGATTGYLRGEERRTTFTWRDATRTLSWERRGSYGGKDCFRSFVATLHGDARRETAELQLAASGKVTIP